jgi:hypothetical protein
LEQGPGGAVVAPPASVPIAGTGGVPAPSNGNMQPGTGVAGGPDAPAPAAGTMPCDVDAVVKSGCQSCHGQTPIGGAPIALLSLADFQRDYTVKTTASLKGQTMKVYELARIRLNREMGTTPMPQNSQLSSEAFATLDGWLRAGAQPGMACGGTAGSGSIDDPPTGGTAGNDPGAGGNSECDKPGAFDPLVEVGDETCYSFQAHGSSSPTDTSKFSVPLDESYSQFYYDVPWAPGSLATRFGSDFDNLPVLHHWLAFASSSSNPAGTVAPNVTGTTLGENAELIAGWAVGGCTTTYPPDVGVKLPSSGKIMVQWHHYNSTGQPQLDGSKVQICTVPPGARPNVAGLTFLGTENFNGLFGMGQGKQEFTTSCTNNSGAPVTILGFTPHMHLIGTNMRSVVTRVGGGTETVFDKPFVFDQQVNYMQDPPIVLQPGDTITSTCTFLNDTGRNVAFGQSTADEMCYQFTLAYPHGALNNGAPSLIGATNICW